MFSDLCNYFMKTFHDSVSHVLLYSYYINDYFYGITKLNVPNRIISSEYNYNTDKIKITYILNNNEYICIFNRNDNVNITELKMLLLQEDLNVKLLDCIVNDTEDITKTMNKYYGPRGDFHEFITNNKLKVKDICNNANFDNLTCMNEMVEMFVSSDLNEEIIF